MNDKQTTLEPASPARRPIPLPPSSLRPPPRGRQATPYHTAPPSRVPEPESEPRALGTRRGFWVGLALPLVGLGIAAALWWAGEGGLEARSPAAPGPPPLAVRSRSSAAPSPERTPVRAPEAAGPVSGGSRTPAAEGGDGTALPAAPAPPQVTVQVGSYRTRAKAERVLAEARKATGLPGVVLDSEVDGVAWHRILLGAFATPEAALEAVRPLAAGHELMVRPLPEPWRPVLTGAPDVDEDVEGGAP